LRTSSAAQPSFRLARFGSHKGFPERQQTLMAKGLLQRNVFDQEALPAAPWPCFANGTDFAPLVGKSDDVVHG
jgi:hypothetical protein